MIDLDEIRKDAAIKHNVLVDKDDPAMMNVTMLVSALEQGIDAMNAQQERNLKALLNALQQGSVEAKKTAEKVITSASDYVSDQMNNAITAAMSEGREELRKDLRLAWTKIEESRKATFMAMGVSIFCAVVTVGSLLLA